MNIDEVRDEIKRRWRELWPPDKDRGHNAGVICPLCGNGSGADGDGVRPVKGSDVVLHCFKCGFSGSALELLGAENGVPLVTKKQDDKKIVRRVASLRGDDFKRAIEIGARRLSLFVDWQNGSAAACKPSASGKKGAVGMNFHKEEKSGSKPPGKDFTAFLEKARDGLDDARAVEYLARRGISIETARAVGLGFCNSWKNPKGGKTESPRLIVPFENGCGYLARAVDDVKEGVKQNGGVVGLFGSVDALKGSDVVFVVEGWADACSVIQAGYNAIALNGSGSAMGAKLIEAASGFSGFFLLALDADDAGKKGADDLGAMLTAAGVPFSVVDICGGFKDENDFLINDPDGFSFACLEAHENAKVAAEKAARPDSILQYVNGGGWREDVKRGSANREKTGFPALDAWLGGGLYEGLTVLSGFPSLGKTSLLWQIGENVASGGCHTLFFSLEMSRADMLAKSLSRRAFANGRDVTSDDAQSGRDDCSRELKEILQDVGARLEVVEGSFGYGIEAIRKRAILAKRRGGRLCVFVDYLQAAADYKGGGSEITAISDTAKAFRQLARELHCPIVCASSTARTNYNSAVDLGVFYGSGGIESAADCAAGLQLSAVYSQEYIDAGRERQGGKEKQASIIDKAAAESPRGVSFIGLKNRRGQMKKRIDFLFDARHCTFLEKAGEVFGYECEDEIPFSDDELSFLSAAPQSAGG